MSCLTESFLELVYNNPILYDYALKYDDSFKKNDKKDGIGKFKTSSHLRFSAEELLCDITAEH